MSPLENHPHITHCLWFDKNAEEAVEFYLSVFKNSRLLSTMRSPADNPSGPKDSVLTVSFELDGQQYLALNGGPNYKFTPAISFVVNCTSQEEIDYYWSRLTEAGGEVACGWLVDKFGLSWQVVPANIGELLKPPKAFQAMMQMKKLDIAALQRAGQS